MIRSRQLLVRSLCLGVASGAVALASAAAAQDSRPQEPASPVEATNTPTDETTEASSTILSAEDKSASGPIVVTGSRIRRTDFDTPNPVLSIGSDQVEKSGTTNLTDFLSGIPALQGSQGSDQNGGENASVGYTGLNLLNLRNLGTERTLVLIDGRRQVAGVNGTQSVDINTIPSDLVERVDILTGGASAIYGADGVSGVVNFVMKKDFEGLTARAQVGTSTHGDAGQRLISVTAGKNLADGRFNIAAAYEHSEEHRLTYAQRPRLSGKNLVGFYLNPDDPENQGNYTGPADNGIPDNVPLSDVRYFDTNRQGGIDVDFDGFPDYFVENGKIVAFDGGKFVPDFYQQGGNATLVSDYRLDLLPKINRDIFNVITHYDVSPALTIFAEGKFARSHSFSLGQPTFDYYLLEKADNPYIPPDVEAAAPFGDVLVNRDNFDLGIRGENIKRKTWRGVLGARGDLGDHLNYEISYVYGKTTTVNHYVDDIYSDRFYAAIDVVTNPVTGQPDCRVNVEGASWVPDQPYVYARTPLAPTTFQPGQCKPLNIFGENVADGPAIKWIQADTTDHEKITQQVLSGSLSGDLGGLFTFPGGGEPGFAVGAEYRKETSDYEPDPVVQQGLTYGNVLSPVTGKFNVKEVFGEVNLPILTGMKFAEKFEIGGAARYSDYSTIGSTWAWKVNATWAPVRDISFVGTYSTAVRAPNIGELYTAPSQTFLFITDPCNASQIQNGTSYREANCTALLSSLGADPATYADNRSTSLPGSIEGNPTLSQETAKTWTVGTILTPRFIPGLSARLDWYDIRIRNAINTATAEEMAGLCVDQPTLDNVYCSLITRQAGANGPYDAGNITDYTLRPFNVAQFRTAGLDLNLNYRLRTERAGTFNLNLIGNYLDRLTFISVPGAPVTDDRAEGSQRSPKYTVNMDLTWNLGRFTANYGLLWFSKTSRFTNQEMAGNPDIVADQYRYLKARWQHDIYVRYEPTKWLQFYAGVNNLFDQKEAIGTVFYPVGPVGRFFFFGARTTLP